MARRCGKPEKRQPSAGALCFRLRFNPPSPPHQTRPTGSVGPCGPPQLPGVLRVAPASRTPWLYPPDCLPDPSVLCRRRGALRRANWNRQARQVRALSSRVAQLVEDAQRGGSAEKKKKRKERGVGWGPDTHKHAEPALVMDFFSFTRSDL